MKANTILAAALMMLSCASANAQSAITYTYDAAGKQLHSFIMTGRTATLDLSPQPAGCYFLAATLNGEKALCRIIKE